MAIPQARIDTAAQAYLESGYNQAAAYRAAHPKAAGNTALQNAPAFMNKYDIKAKAQAILNSHKMLSLKSVLTGFTEPLTATNGIYFKGEKIAEEPAHNVRLEARKYLSKLYGLEQPEAIVDQRHVNITLEAQDAGKLEDIIGKLEQLKAIATADISNRADTIDE